MIKHTRQGAASLPGGINCGRTVDDALDMRNPVWSPEIISRPSQFYGV
jgi:hypothetical protein